MLDEHLEHAADVIADLVFRPLLRAEDLELERNVVLEEISMVEDTPDDLVFELHNEALWGQHPYGYSILGTRDTVSALGVRELRELHERAYHPPQLVDRGLRQRPARSVARGARAHRVGGGAAWRRDAPVGAGRPCPRRPGIATSRRTRRRRTSCIGSPIDAARATRAGTRRCW